jgi:hypothetical protein
MIVATRTINPETGSETIWWEFGEPSESFDGRPCEVVDNHLLSLMDTDLCDLPGILSLFRYQKIGQDDRRSYWARQAAR